MTDKKDKTSQKAFDCDMVVRPQTYVPWKGILGLVMMMAYVAYLSRHIHELHMKTPRRDLDLTLVTLAFLIPAVVLLWQEGRCWVRSKTTYVPYAFFGGLLTLAFYLMYMSVVMCNMTYFTSSPAKVLVLENVTMATLVASFAFTCTEMVINVHRLGSFQKTPSCLVESRRLCIV